MPGDAAVVGGIEVGESQSLLAPDACAAHGNHAAVIFGNLKIGQAWCP